MNIIEQSLRGKGIYYGDPAMGNAAQKRATQNYRVRLTQRGFTRFEIMALESAS
ncbi:hypothetical protein ACVII1_007729 [Bradyrhizobium elkanii]